MSFCAKDDRLDGGTPDSTADLGLRDVAADAPAEDRQHRDLASRDLVVADASPLDGPSDLGPADLRPEIETFPDSSVPDLATPDSNTPDAATGDAPISPSYFNDFSQNDQSDFSVASNGTWIIAEEELRQTTCLGSARSLIDKNWINLIAEVDFRIDEDCSSGYGQVNIGLRRYSGGTVCEDNRGYSCVYDHHAKYFGCAEGNGCDRYFTNAYYIPTLVTGTWYHLRFSASDTALQCTLSGPGIAQPHVANDTSVGVLGGTVSLGDWELQISYDNLRVTPY